MAEYALILGFVAAVCVAGFAALGNVIPGPLNTLAGFF